jgi:hypothetical protein
VSTRIAVYRIGESAPHHYIRRSRAQKKVLSARYRWRDAYSVEEIKPAMSVAVSRPWSDGALGTGNVLPFSTVQNQLRQPERINYPIPAVGAHSRPMKVKVINASPNELSLNEHDE